MPWQDRALQYMAIVPEINFASRFYSRMLKQLRIFPAERNEQDEKKEIKSGVPVDVLNRIQDPGGGRSAILGSYGRLMFGTGEGILFGRDLDTDNERWQFVWNGELEFEHSDETLVSITHLLGGGKKRTYSVPGQAVAYRMWTPSPRKSSDAESPMMAALDIAEELIILTKSVHATATSRMTNGFLFLPSEIEPPPLEPGSDEDPKNSIWAEDMIEHIMTAIENPGTPEQLAPFVSWVRGEYISMIKHIKTHDPTTDYMEKDLRAEAITRLSYGLDMPPEALKGLGSTNHWAAMQILGDMWKSHGAPLAEQFCDELSSAYLQPALKEEGYENWRSVVVHYDASQVVVKPDRSDDADAAAKLALIGGRGYRIMKNIPEEWAPTPEERKELLEALGRSTQQPRVPQTAPAQNGDSSRNGPPPPGPEGDSGRRTRVVTSSASAAYEAMGAAMMALARCRELAGIRLWQKQRVCPECFESADGQPHALVASIVGPQTVQKLEWTPQRLVRGGTDTFKDMLIYWGYSDTQAQAICELIEGFAARTLYDERLPQLPNGFAAHLERARETV